MQSLRINDLRIVSGNVDRDYNYTLCGLIHDEMFFLPSFLDHYRKLGIDRFVFLDDKSKDGSFDFLADQPDVIVVHSDHKFNDVISPEECQKYDLTSNQMHLAWRSFLLRDFCCGEWAIQVDADEFLDLAEGATIADLVNRSQTECIWSVMIDMYPKTLKNLSNGGAAPIFDPVSNWYFDGRPHLKLHKNKPPSKVYNGSRARLLFQHDLNGRTNRFEYWVRKLLRLNPPNYNAIRKPAVLKWNANASYKTSHSTTLTGADDILLPLRHYKFNSATYKRIENAIIRGTHGNGSSEYRDLEKLFKKLHETDGSFIGKHSTKYEGFESFKQSGVTIGL